MLITKTITVVIAVGIYAIATNGNIEIENKETMINKTEVEKDNQLDNTRKNILARGCDPIMSLEASKAIPPLIGNPEYVPTTNDVDFIEKLKSRKWSVIFFAPGACRYSAATQQIPGGNMDTKNWTLEQYRELVYDIQGDDVLIVETVYERETIGLLTNALEKARETK